MMKNDENKNLRGKETLLGNFNNACNIKEDMNFKKHSAFSLIELSIVLIIIGLLVAGVTGGASLIESAKVRSFANELNSYKQALYTFYAAKQRLPGDLNMDGIIGNSRIDGISSETYTTSSFPEPYNVQAPNYSTAPFIDLYLEKVIDFRPDPNYVGSAYKDYSVPSSKVSKYSKYQGFETWEGRTDCSPCFPTNGIILNFWNSSATKHGLTAKFVKKVDEKIDDGVADTGNLYSNGTTNNSVGSTNYDKMMDGHLAAIRYKVFDYN